MPVSPEVQRYIGQEEEPTGPSLSPEIDDYLKKAGIQPLKKTGLGEPEGGPTKPKPSKIAPKIATPVDTTTFNGKGTGRSWEPESFLGKIWHGIQDGDNRPDEHLEGFKPEDASPVKSVEFRPVGSPEPRKPIAKPAAQPSDVSRVTPKGSIKSEMERLNAPAKSREVAAETAREIEQTQAKRADSLRTASDTTGLGEAERTARDAGKTARALEETKGPLATMASAFGESIGLFGGKDPYEHENRIIRESAAPGVLPTPKEQAAAGAKHPGRTTSAPSLTSPEGAAAFAGQLPAFMAFEGAGKVGEGLLGQMARTIGEGKSIMAPAARAVTRAGEKIEAARTLPSGPRLSVTSQPVEAFKDEARLIMQSLKPRLAKGLTEGMEGGFGVAYSSARSQGQSPEEALKTAFESLPAGIPMGLGFEALATLGGPLARFTKAGAGKAGEAAMATGATGATPMVDAMRQAKEAHQLPNIPGAKTRYDTPEIVAARAKVGAMRSTHLDDSPERQAFREQAAATHFENAKQYAPEGKPEAGKQIWIVVGPPGAGKSSIIRKIAQESRAMVTDADDVKKLTPEQQADRDAANAVHLESSRINGRVLAQAVKSGLNVIWPTVGSNGKDLGDRVSDLKKAGYDVHVKYVGAPSAVTARRITERWKAGQQGFVDPAYSLALKGVPFATFRELGRRSDISSYEEYDNSVDGRPPQLVRSSSDPRKAFTQEIQSPAGAGARAGRPEGGERGVPRGNEPAARPEVARQPGLVGLMQEAVEAAPPPKKTTVGDKARDLALRAAPHAAEIGEAVASHGHLAAPLVAAALPGSDEEKTKRAALAGAVFLAPRFRNKALEQIEAFRSDPVYAPELKAEPRGWTEWAQRLSENDYSVRQKLGEVLRDYYEARHPENTRNVNGLPAREQVLTLDEVQRAIEEMKAPQRGVPLVSRLRKFIAATPAENPRALGKAWDQPKPVADWIGKIQSGAAQAGVKKEEIQLLVSALKGERGVGEATPKDTPRAALDRWVSNPDFQQNAAERHRIEDWATWINREWVGRPKNQASGVVLKGLLDAMDAVAGEELTADQVRERLAKAYPEPKNAVVPAKLTRADVLKLLDERLPQVERVVLSEGAAEPDFDPGYHDADADAAEIRPIQAIAVRLPEMNWEAREELIRHQIADRNAAKKDLVAEIRRNRALDAEDIDTDASPAEIIEAQGWDPNAMEAHIEARRKRIAEIESEMEEKVDEARSEASEAYDRRQDHYRELDRRIGRRGADRVLNIIRDGWEGDGFHRDTIDNARQEAVEYLDSPDFDSRELLRDNGFDLKEVDPEWVITPHEDQQNMFTGEHGAAGHTEVRYTPEQVQEFLAKEYEEQWIERHGVPPVDRDWEGFKEPDVDEIDQKDVLRLYRKEYGDGPIDITQRKEDEYVIVARGGQSDGEIQTRRWGRQDEYRGDDEYALMHEFISDNDLDQALRDEQYDEIAQVVSELIDAYRKEAEADDRVNQLDNPEEYSEFEDERQEIANHEQAIEDFKDAKESPSAAPLDAGERAAKVSAATKKFNLLNDEIDKLVEMGKQVYTERKRLGAGPSKPEPQGEPHYDGTQVSPGPREDYAELIPIWANAPVNDRAPAQTHFSSHGFPEDIGHQRVSTHLHYEIPGLDAEGYYSDVKPNKDGYWDTPLDGTKERYNRAVASRKQAQERLREIEEKLEPLDRIGMERMTPEQQAQARELASDWGDANSTLSTAMGREANIIVDLAEEMKLKPIRIRIMEENQADPAQTAASRGVDRPGSKGTTPPNPFMTGGTEKRVATGRDGAEIERWDVNGDLTYRLGAVNAFADAIERDESFFGWQDADTAAAVHNFRRKAAKHVYEEVTPSAIRDGLRFAGIPEKDIPKPEHMIIAGAGHWVIKLTPEIKAAVKKVGLPIMGLALLAGTAKPAGAQDQTKTGKPDTSNLKVWLATGVGAAIGAAALAWSRKNKGPRTPAVQAMLDEVTAQGTRRGKPDYLFRRREPTGPKYSAPIDVKQTKSGKGPALLNVGKLGLSTEGEKVWTDVVKNLDLKKQRVSQAATMEEAQRRATSPDDLLTERRWTGADALAARLFQSSASERLAGLAQQLTQGVKTPEERTAIQAEMARLTADIGTMAKRASGERESAGRTLNAYKIVAKNTLDEPTWQMLGERAKGLALETDEILKIRALTTAHDRDGLTSFVAGLHKSSLLDKWLTFWKAGLLTGVGTHVANALSNASESAILAAKEPLAVGIDAVIAMARGTEREKALSPTAIQARLRGFKKGLGEAKDVMRTGVTAEEAGKWNVRRTNYDSPILQAYTDLVFNALAAADRPFRVMALESALDELSVVYARKAVKADPKLKFETVRQQLRKAPTNEMSSRAIDEAERAVFQNKGTLSKMATGMMSAAREHPAARLAAETVVPFTSTPSNVATRFVDTTPIGIVTAILRQTKGEFKQARFSEDLARSLTGSGGLMLLGYWLASRGEATGTYPSDQGEKTRWQVEKKNANAVKLRGKWVNAARLGPTGMTIAAGAQLHTLLQEEPKSAAKLIGGMLGTFGRITTDQSFLRGVSSAITAVNDPVKQGDTFTKSLAGSVVPSMLGRMAQAVDPVQREANSATEQIQSRIPILSKRLPEKLNAFGEPNVRTKGERAAVLVDPFSTTKASTDPVVQELERLDVGMPSSRRSVYEATGESRAATPEERRNETAGLGPILHRVYETAINHPQYEAMPDETKRALLERASRLPADAMRYVGSRRGDATAPTDMIERRALVELRQLMAKAAQESNTGVSRLSRTPRSSPSPVPAGTPVSPEVAAYLRQQRLDARRRPATGKTP